MQDRNNTVLVIFYLLKPFIKKILLRLTPGISYHPSIIDICKNYLIQIFSIGITLINHYDCFIVSSIVIYQVYKEIISFIPCTKDWVIISSRCITKIFKRVRGFLYKMLRKIRTCFIYAG